MEILLWSLALLCNWHGSLRLDYPTSHAIFCPKGTENWCFSAHAVMILILLYTLVGRQLSHSLGRRQRRYRTGKDHMLRKGAKDKRGWTTGTWGPWAFLCTRIRRVRSKPSFLDVQTQEVGRVIREQSRHLTTNWGHAEDENCIKDLGHLNKSLTCTLYSLYMYICTYI